MYINKVNEIKEMTENIKNNEFVDDIRISEIDLGSGSASASIIVIPFHSHNCLSIFPISNLFSS